MPKYSVERLRSHYKDCLDKANGKLRKERAEHGKAKTTITRQECHIDALIEQLRSLGVTEPITMNQAVREYNDLSRAEARQIEMLNVSRRIREAKRIADGMANAQDLTQGDDDRKPSAVEEAPVVEPARVLPAVVALVPGMAAAPLVPMMVEGHGDGSSQDSMSSFDSNASVYETI